MCSYVHRRLRARISSLSTLLLTVWVLSPVSAQLSRPPQPSPVQYSPQLVSEIKKVQQAALESDYAYRQLAHLSNNIGPRLSGSAQTQKAVEYVAAELRKLGLEVQLEKVIVPHTGATRYADDAPKIPAGAVASEDADLIAHLTSEGKVRMRVVLTPQTLPDAVSYNVIADLKGSEHPEQVVIISGHLDSWDLGRGAIDDGAGVVMAMQTAQLLKQLHLRPKRTIRVSAWMNEENGLMGGRTYINDYRSDVANHFAAIEADLGAGHPLGIYAQGKPEILTLLQPLAVILQTQGAGLTRSAEETGSDISPPGAAGVPTSAPIQDARTYFNYHHTAADTLDKVNPREPQENCAGVATLAYTLASMPQSLPR